MGASFMDTPGGMRESTPLPKKSFTKERVFGRILRRVKRDKVVTSDQDFVGGAGSVSP